MTLRGKNYTIILRRSPLDVTLRDLAPPGIPVETVPPEFRGMRHPVRLYKLLHEAYGATRADARCGGESFHAAARAWLLLGWRVAQAHEAAPPVAVHRDVAEPGSLLFVRRGGGRESASLHAHISGATTEYTCTPRGDGTLAACLGLMAHVGRVRPRLGDPLAPGPFQVAFSAVRGDLDALRLLKRRGR
jgi:hypothetical protein